MVADLATAAAVLAVYVALLRFVLPKLGVPT
jgi:hypothetical protein